MRAILASGLLLVLLGVGVVQAHHSGEGAGDGFVARWIQPRVRSPEAEAAVPASQEPEPTPDRARPAAKPSAGPAVLAAGELSVLDSDAPLPMVRYVDAQGSIHMVRGLERVPAAHRANAVVLGRGNVNLLSVPTPSAGAFQDWMPEPNPNRTDVVLFGAPWCGACQSAKRHLERRGVRYTERDIDSDDAAMQEVERVLGRVAIPLLEVDGRYISGFRPDVYDRALGQG